MIKALNLAVVFFMLTSVAAQQKTSIVYRTSVYFDFDFLKKEVTDGEHEKTDSLKELAPIDQLAKVIPDMIPVDTTRAVKVGNFIKTTCIQEGTKQRLYELPAKRLLIVESKGGPDKFDTTYSETFNCPADSACNFELSRQEKNGVKTILGFSCTNYIVKDQDGLTLYSLWVTNQVKPALPVHALIRSPKIMLEGYTAPEFKDYHGDGSETHQQQTAIKIIH